jgi:hypothetical protein
MHSSGVFSESEALYGNEEILNFLPLSLFGWMATLRVRV